jgi:hypothetical protein
VLKALVGDVTLEKCQIEGTAKPQMVARADRHASVVIEEAGDLRRQI